MVDVDVEGPAQGVELLVRGTDDDHVLHLEGRHARLSLERGSTYAVMASAEGFKAEIGAVRSTHNPAVLLDFVPLAATFGSNMLGTAGTQAAVALPLLSMGLYLVDVFTHADRKHAVNHVSLKLVPEATP
jgi:hypothetical protein